MKEIIAILSTIAIGVILLVFGVNLLCKTVDRNVCTNFSMASERDVKFAEYNYFMWDCLTPSSDGKWISATLLREITD